jgi:glyoxylase-like metal-dependent hydrolase (beta-lactamase superfamily II)
MALTFDRSLEAPYGTVEQLSPMVARLLAPNPSAFTFRGTGVYIVGAGDKVAVIDPGPNLPEHVAALTRALAGRTVSHILITHTHADHSPAAAPLKALTGAKTYGFGPHGAGGTGEESADRAFAPDIAVADGTILRGQDFTIECVFTPGHTSNHMCYALAEEEALFTGDHVMGWSTTVVAPPDGNMGDYMKSLEKLIARHDRILYPTHGSPIVKPAPFVRALLTHRRMREAQIKSCIARGHDTLPALVERLYADTPVGLHKAAALTVRAHLEQMQAEGRVVQDADGRYALPDHSLLK